MKRCRVLVTGGAGFIGSHLCEELLECGNEVICLDNFHTGTMDNILKFIDNPFFRLIKHDIVKPIFLEVDQIYNLACPASPIHYQHNPVETVKTNVLGAINMLDLANRFKAKILHASTSEVYGDPQVHPQSENYWGNVNPIGPRACYDEGKRCAETLFFDYYRQYMVNIRVVRIFNTYGSHMCINDGRAVSNFTVQALNGQDITVNGDGSQTRSFCYVSDMVDALIRAMNSPVDFTGPLNLGNPAEFTILELAERIVELTGSKSKIIFSPLPQDDPQRRKPDITLAKQLLNWAPQVSLEEGLTLTTAYFKSILDKTWLQLSLCPVATRQLQPIL